MIKVSANVEKAVNASASIANDVSRSAEYHIYDSTIGIYDGAYNVAPSFSTQTLQTAGYKMAQDVTIEPLEAYAGSYEITPFTSAQTLQTSGKTLTDDIIIDAVPVFAGATTIDPSLTANTIMQTAGKMMSSDVTVLKADLSATTAQANDMMPGKYFYDANGLLTNGIMTPLEKVQDLYNTSFLLSTTSYDDWEASTSASSILASIDLGTFTADMANYTYFIKWKYRIDMAYLAGVTLKAIPIKQCIESWQVIYRRFNNLTQLSSDTMPYNAVATQMSAPVEHYYNTSGTITIYLSSTYGIYMTPVACTFSSTSSDTPTVTYKRPTISARCNSSYFALGRKPYIDSANTTIKIKGELWRVKMSTALPDLYAGVQDIFNNGIA